MLDIATLVAAAGCALIAGAFFAFSTFVMKALAALPAPHGIAAMQSINVVVINPLFLTPFVGTAVLSTGLAATALLRWQEPGAAFLLGGGLLYVVGTFLVTMTRNVPRNDALAKVTPTSAEAARFWTNYVRTWTRWNHVRTLAALAATVAFALAFRAQGQ
jgi:uncharacterized membrane protein